MSKMQMMLGLACYACASTSGSILRKHCLQTLSRRSKARACLCSTTPCFQTATLKVSVTLATRSKSWRLLKPDVSAWASTLCTISPTCQVLLPATESFFSTLMPSKCCLSPSPFRSTLSLLIYSQLCDAHSAGFFLVSTHQTRERPSTS